MEGKKGKSMKKKSEKNVSFFMEIILGYGSWELRRK